MSHPASTAPSPEVQIYLRNSQKRAHLLRLPRHLDSDQLLPLASQKLNLPADRLLLFLKGERIHSGQQLTLTEKCILHAVDLAQVQRPQLQIHVKRLSGSHPLAHFAIPSSTLVQDFINHQLNGLYQQTADEIFLVYTGKQLGLAKTFEEEYVEEGAELLCVELQQPPPFIAERVKREKSKLKEGEGKEEFGPGRPSLDSFGKKQTTNVSSAAPGGEESAAPPNHVKVHNIPKEVQAELKSGHFTAVIAEPLLHGGHRSSIHAGEDVSHRFGEPRSSVEDEWANRPSEDSQEEEEATEVKEEREKV